ncbi:hypothetical protein [Corynebacterium singulare]|uniref:hypothetical protein n=1 Tax=Corynebacterium singulare TaxID=161899 RepID=UPI00119F21E3|nr:hypothetical protein [Corynebacterium singulare]
MAIQKRSRKYLSIVAAASIVASGSAVASAQESTPYRTPARFADSIHTTSNVPSIEQVQIEPENGSTEAEEQGKIKTVIKAGLEALKRINKGWYDKVISKSKEGKATFVSWWDKHVPESVRDLFIGISASAIWQFINDYLL